MSTAAAARPSILSHFEDLSDPRMDRTKLHRLSDMVAIALCAAICGAEGWADVERFGKMKKGWFAKFLERERAPQPLLTASLRRRIGTDPVRRWKF